MFIAYITLVLLNAHLAYSWSGWVDPHDMNVQGSGANYRPENRVKHDEAQQCDCPPVPINFPMAHYKRLINLLLGAVALDRIDATSFQGRLHINIPIDKYDFLRDFAKSTDNKEDAAVLRQLDQIFSGILVKPSHQHLIEGLISWTDHIYFTFYNRTTGILASCLFVLFISYKLLRANLTIWSVVKYLIFLGWVTDFAFTWINLLQEAEINKMADSLKYESVLPHCNPNEMTFWQYVVYTFRSNDECRNYHHAIYKDHFWSIAPVTVLSHQFGTVIYTPASYIGQALGSFASGLLSTLPWGVNIILFPALLIFSVIILCIILSFLTNTSFGFNFLHILHLNFGNNQRRNIGDVLTGQNLSALLSMAHRNMIEDVRQSDTVGNSVKAECSNCSNASDKQSEDAVCLKTDETLAVENFEDKSSSNEKLQEKSENVINLDKHDGSGDK